MVRQRNEHIGRWLGQAVTGLAESSTTRSSLADAADLQIVRFGMRAPPHGRPGSTFAVGFGGVALARRRRRR
jgi:hypothetical protein